MIHRRAARLIGTLTAICISTLAVGCSNSPDGPTTPAASGDTFADLAPIELTLNHTNPAGGHFETSADAFTTYIEKATDGKVTFDVLYSGALLPASEAFSGVGSGIADISYTTTIGFEDHFPVGAWLSTVLSQDPQPFPKGDLVNHLAVNELVMSDLQIRGEFEALNVAPLWFASSSPGDMLCVEPISNSEDASGRLARSGGARLTEEIESLDMTAISMAFTDLYEGLQRGAIDCVYTTAGNTTFKPYGLSEVAKHYIPVNGWTPLAAAGFVINLDRWSSFSPALQQVFREASALSLASFTEGGLEVVADFGSTAEEAGVTFAEVPELQEDIAALHAERYEDLATSAPPGTTDAAALISTLDGLRAKYLDLVTPIVTVNADAAPDGEGLRIAFTESTRAVDWEAFTEILMTEAGRE